MADLRGDLDLSARYLDVIRALRLSPETPLPAMTAALTRAREAHVRIAAGAPSQTWKAIDGEDVRHVALRLAEGIQQSEGVTLREAIARALDRHPGLGDAVAQFWRSRSSWPLTGACPRRATPRWRP